MTAPLTTVAQYIADTRVLLLDKVQPYRYDDTELVQAFNLALLEGRRLRADLFVTRFGNEVPSYSGVSGDAVPIEPQFRSAFVYGTAAYALLRDEEDVQDTRSNMFLAKMASILTGRVAPIGGGTPGPGNAQQ